MGSESYARTERLALIASNTSIDQRLSALPNDKLIEEVITKSVRRVGGFDLGRGIHDTHSTGVATVSLACDLERQAPAPEAGFSMASFQVRLYSPIGAINGAVYINVLRRSVDHLCLSLGFRTSSIAYPTKVNPSTTKTMQRPGMIMNA